MVTTRISTLNILALGADRRLWRLDTQRTRALPELVVAVVVVDKRSWEDMRSLWMLWERRHSWWMPQLHILWSWLGLHTPRRWRSAGRRSPWLRLWLRLREGTRSRTRKLQERRHRSSWRTASAAAHTQVAVAAAMEEEDSCCCCRCTLHTRSLAEVKPKWPQQLAAVVAHNSWTPSSTVAVRSKTTQQQ